MSTLGFYFLELPISTSDVSMVENQDPYTFLLFKAMDITFILGEEPLFTELSSSPS